jgi:hypothetical protein
MEQKLPHNAPQRRLLISTSAKKKSDWGNLVPRINVENGIKSGYLLE